MYAKTTAAAQ